MRIRGYALGAPCWADVAGSDHRSAQQFYGGLFGWALSNNGLPTWRLRDFAVAGYVPGHPTGWLMYVAVADADATAAEAVRAGGRVLRAPCDAGPYGRSAVLADPTGVAFAVWQRRAFGGAQLFNEPGTICWYELASQDPARAIAFYRTLFGWQTRRDEANPGAFEWINGEDVVAGLSTGSTGWQVQLMVNDCMAAADQMAGLGGRVLGPLRDNAMCRQATLIDPAGARFVVVELATEVRRALL